MLHIKLDAAAYLLRLCSKIRLNHVHIMGNHDEGHMMMLMHMLDHSKETNLRFNINTYRRLIQDEQLRVVNDGTSQESSLLLTA